MLRLRKDRRRDAAVNQTMESRAERDKRSALPKQEFAGSLINEELDGETQKCQIESLPLR